MNFSGPLAISLMIRKRHEKQVGCLRLREMGTEGLMVSRTPHLVYHTRLDLAAWPEAVMKGRAQCCVSCYLLSARTAPGNGQVPCKALVPGGTG